MRDAFLELRIKWHHWLALLLGLYGYTDRARFHWQTAFYLVRQRSPQQIARMEKRLGLS